MRDGKLYLSEKDAIALAIENNLDVEIERYNLVLADTDRRRAAGGGNLRGIDYTIQEPPNGVGGPGSPLLNTTAVNPNPTTPTVTDLTSLNSTQQVQVNLAGNSTATAMYAPGRGAAVRSQHLLFGWLPAPLRHRDADYHHRHDDRHRNDGPAAVTDAAAAARLCSREPVLHPGLSAPARRLKQPRTTTRR